VDALRYTLARYPADSPLTLDAAEMTRQASDNPVFYVQYAHARIHQIVAKAGAQGVTRGPLADADLSLLVHERELDVLRALAELPEVIALAATERAPHKVVNWVRAAAGAFHGFYHDCYVLGDGVSPELTQARLWLVEAARIGVLIGLGTVGVSAPESM
jgi:arginyl-tRNA synthetase